MLDMKIEDDTGEILTVSQLNLEARTVLERKLPVVWVDGEISNFAAPASGHLYFTLKDNFAQVRCAMFRNRNSKLDFKPANGNQVLVRGNISLYEQRGEYQLIIQHMEEAGEGALRREFELLKKKLQQEGLFSAENKQDPPSLPNRIGIVTSPTGAALQDMLHILKRRFPAIPITVYPCVVQGATASQEVINALTLANQQAKCDVLIVARGGGSLEDLFAFNDEQLARAIYASKLPVITGVGHETDITIADFVADVRAPTPSGAAELVTPERAELQRQLDQNLNRLLRGMQNNISQQQVKLEHLDKRLQSPGERLNRIGQRLDELEQRLVSAVMQNITSSKAALATQQATLQQHNPQYLLTSLKDKEKEQSQRLQRAMQTILEQHKSRLVNSVSTLEAVSPLATIARGYAVVTDKDNKVVTSTKQVVVGDEIIAKVTDGEVDCKVVSVNV